MILPADRNPRLVSTRRGGLLADADHQLLALWHDLGAAAYAIKAASAAVPHEQERGAARAETDWQRQQIPGHLRSLVLEDQNCRSSICWSVFDD